MEFKGTKGKWIVDTEESYLNESGVLSTPISIENFMIGFIDVYGDQPEDKANALLISKAPEMLELLKHFCNANRDDENWNYIACMAEAHKLIKEATEL